MTKVEEGSRHLCDASSVLSALSSLLGHGNVQLSSTEGETILFIEEKM